MKGKLLKQTFFGLLLFCCMYFFGCGNPGNSNKHPKTASATTEHIDTGSLSKTNFPEVTIKNTEVREYKSAFTGEIYEIDVFFPDGYNQEKIDYPIVFVLDAEYNFGCVAYIARRLIKNGDIPKIILVGIAYKSDDEEHYYNTRMKDCTPPSAIHGHHTGGVENFIVFFKQELIPFVRSNYRTQDNNITIVGHSIGGFFCGYSLFNHPGIFNNYIIVSPSFWFSDEVIFEYEKTFAQNLKELNASVFLVTGANESERMLNTSRIFINRIHERNYQNLRFGAMIPEGEHHRSVFPLAFTRGLQFIFGND